nr:heme o synthase [Bacillus kwashiorkori]
MENVKAFLIDMKFLVKGKVLVANVLPVFTGFWLALFFSGNTFSDNVLLFFLTMIGSTLVISGALMLNNWYEVDLDQKMERTQKRPTVTGSFSLTFVLWLGIITTIIGITVMLFTTLEATIYSFLGWFVYVVLYTFWSKRKYTVNTIIGSVSGAFTPLIGWAAIDSAFHIVPIVLFLILFIWQVPHTLAIAINRLEDYRAAGVPMLPVKMGIPITKRVNFVYVLCLLPLPFLLLTSLGLIFVVVATILNIVYLILAGKGLFTNDHIKWAKVNFVFSLNYLILLSFTMIILTSPIFG